MYRNETERRNITCCFLARTSEIRRMIHQVCLIKKGVGGRIATITTLDCALLVLICHCIWALITERKSFNLYYVWNSQTSEKLHTMHPTHILCSCCVLQFVNLYKFKGINLFLIFSFVSQSRVKLFLSMQMREMAFKQSLVNKLQYTVLHIDH